MVIKVASYQANDLVRYAVGAKNLSPKSVLVCAICGKQKTKIRNIPSLWSSGESCRFRYGW